MTRVDISVNWLATVDQPTLTNWLAVNEIKFEDWHIRSSITGDDVDAYLLFKHEKDAIAFKLSFNTNA